MCFSAYVLNIKHVELQAWGPSTLRQSQPSEEGDRTVRWPPQGREQSFLLIHPRRQDKNPPRHTHIPPQQHCFLPAEAYLHGCAFSIPQSFTCWGLIFRCLMNSAICACKIWRSYGNIFSSHSHTTVQALSTCVGAAAAAATKPPLMAPVTIRRVEYIARLPRVNKHPMLSMVKNDTRELKKFKKCLKCL